MYTRISKPFFYVARLAKIGHIFVGHLINSGAFMRARFALALLTSLATSAFAATREDILNEGQRALSENKIPHALTLYEDYLKANPKDVEVLCLLAMSQGFAGNPAGQEAYSRKALALDLHAPDALANLGNALSTQEKWEEAERTYLDGYAQAKDRRDASSMRNIACALSNLYLMRPNPNDHEAIRWADLCLARISQSVLSGQGAFIGLHTVRPMEAMLEMATYSAATLNKAGAYGNLGETQKAKDVLEAHLKRYPQDPRAQDLLARFS
ncbi:MAG: hypothetical protein C0514_09190 [Candidatus Puniceispirillum sp.]|nr:hypothetical protein [Candidatus Puniceispirillum sp.]